MYKHGVYVTEQPTSIKPPVNTAGCLPVIIGTAPIHLAKSPAKPNTPVLCYSYSEAVEAFGFSDDFKNYTLSEAIYAAFALYGAGPLVLINVLDLEKHKISKANQTVNVVEHEAVIPDAVLFDTIVVNDNTGSTTLENNTDFVLTRMDDGTTKITLLQGSHYDATTLTLNYQFVDPTKVTKADIIGGIDTESGTNKGLECVNSVFSKVGLVPGMIMAPRFSTDSEVAAVMAAKADKINGLFPCQAIIDADTTTVRKYTEVAEWKNKNGVTHSSQIVIWPKNTLGERIFDSSVTFMGRQLKLTADNGDIPHESPSNKNASIDGLCLDDGTEIDMMWEQANYLNSQGIVTVLNFMGGWKLWGDETACYPSNTDPKDRFIPCRFMFNWDTQTFIQTYFPDIDKPLLKRRIESIVESENIRLNGLVASGVLVAGTIEYRSEDNPTTGTIDGIAKFHKTFTPPVPMRVIDAVMEFDAEAYKAALG